MSAIQQRQASMMAAAPAVVWAANRVPDKVHSVYHYLYSIFMYMSKQFDFFSSVASNMVYRGPHQYLTIGK